ncbi:hypothetical protein [Planomicrobium sp. Y74]|uniref:hypothetical protein n=1 Tax=Planomicrobium sp. Y74 TaxID=2478977 RepID=UPI000EF4B117|nr:hypothetical protein [Planomicrobium sp. Y74]RLQ86707.1 hypothetical protein D9754_14900 [Planomicrobium sp. Y74]
MTMLRETSSSSTIYKSEGGRTYKSEFENYGRGLRVKYHRIEQGLSLKELAAGNLSQENLRLAEMEQFPLEDKVYKKLCLRLGIPLDPFVLPLVETGILELKSLLTHIKSRSKMIEAFDNVQNQKKDHLKEIYRIELLIHTIRYYVVTGDVSAALETYEKACKFKDLMNSQQLFFLNKYRGNICYSEGNYLEALNIYKSCLTSAPLDLPSPEMADLLYTLGITSGHLVEPLDAVSYAGKALELYQDMFYPKRIAECHICIGLAEHKTLNFKNGFNHMQKAAMVVEEVHLPELEFLIEYNLGYFYFQFQDFESTIRHVEKCLKTSESGSIINEIRCYTSLIKANFELGRKDKALEWCEVGTQTTFEMEESTLSNKVVADVFNQFHLMKSLIYENHERFEYLAEMEILPLFASNGYDTEYAYYCTLVANYYREVGQKEKAMELYRKSGDIYRKVISIS